MHIFWISTNNSFFRPWKLATVFGSAWKLKKKTHFFSEILKILKFWKILYDGIFFNTAHIFPEKLEILKIIFLKMSVICPTVPLVTTRPPVLLPRWALASPAVVRRSYPRWEYFEALVEVLMNKWNVRLGEICYITVGGREGTEPCAGG